MWTIHPEKYNIHFFPIKLRYRLKTLGVCCKFRPWQCFIDLKHHVASFVLVHSRLAGVEIGVGRIKVTERGG